MGGRWSIYARNLDDKHWKVGEDYCSFIKWVFMGIYCICKYDVVDLGKHG